jgi:hypothetical protein
MTGIALVGAIEVLEEHGYRFHRVAGPSAGPIGCHPDCCLGGGGVGNPIRRFICPR